MPILPAIRPTIRTALHMEVVDSRLHALRHLRLHMEVVDGRPHALRRVSDSNEAGAGAGASANWAESRGVSPAQLPAPATEGGGSGDDIVIHR